jgi:adenylyltransferase/sulfurtransferase
VPGIFGGLQAFEAMKLLLGLPGQLKDELLVLDLLTLTTSRVRTKRASTCPDHAIARATAVQAAAIAQANAGLGDAQAAASPLELSFDTLDQAHDAGFDIVDIREPQELVETPTPSAYARSLPMAQLLHSQPPFEPTRKTVLVCASGRRSLAATRELRERGIADVYSLSGGVKGLQAHIFT